MPRLPLLAALLCLLLPGPGALSRADERPADEGGSLRLFHAHALLAGRSDFLGERVGLVSPDEVNDESRPLFGGESEEPQRCVGSVDELIELLRSEVDPASWTSVSGADLRALTPGTLLVRNDAGAQAGVGEALKRHEDRWLRTIVVDVQAVRLPVSGGAARPTPQTLEAWATAKERGPGLTLCLLPGQRVSAHAGGQLAYVADFDVEVAQKARISDPIVMVANVGLVVDVRALPDAAGARVLLGLEARLAELLGLAPTPAGKEGTGEEREVEAPRLATTSVRVVTEVPTGVWTLLDGGTSAAPETGWALLARARVLPRASGPASRGVTLPALEAAGLGRFGRRTYGIDALTLPVRSLRGRLPTLVPSNYTPPEAPELPEPTPAIPSEVLLELVRQAVAPESWNREGSSLEVRSGALIARAPEPVLDSVGALMGVLARELLWTVEVEAEVLAVDADVAVVGVLLDDAAAAGLEAARAQGRARTLERARVTSMHGARNTVSVGRERTYLADYDVEIAEDSVIANPVLQRLQTGITLDVAPAPSSTGDSAVLSVRFGRCVAEEPLRVVTTCVGPVQAPATSVFSLRTDLDVPFGRTAVVGAATDGPGRSRTLVLLTPRLRRAGD